MGQWLQRNLSCFECGSSDAMQESEHHYKCFSCGKSFLKREKGDVVSSETPVIRDKNLLPCGSYYDIKSRKITRDTAQKYKISCTKYTGTFGHGDNIEYVDNHWVFLFNKHSNGSLVSQKIRSCENKSHMKIVGDTSNKELFGQSLFPPNPNRPIIITEGEFDAAVVYQETGYASVSINNGAESAVSNIRANIDWLSKWANCILAFDNDKPGQDATQKVIEANLFEPGKLKLAHWALKDANDMLLADKSLEIKKAIWDAEEYRPKDLFTPKDCVELALTEPKAGVKTPWPDLTKALNGWRLNTVVTVAAADGIGKTELVDEVLTSLIEQNCKVWIYSSEQEPEETLQRQAGKQLGIPLHIPNAKWDKDAIREKILSFENKIYMWRPEKAISTEEVFERMRYASIAYGTKYFIIDHLKGVESQLTDPIRGMGKFLCDLKGFVKVHKACVILMAHVAKDKKQGRVGQTDESWNRGRVPTKESVYGSSAITAWSDVIIALSRNVESEDPYEACVTKLSILKNRLMGNRGIKAIYLQYVEDVGRLIELSKADYEEATKENE